MGRIKQLATDVSVRMGKQGDIDAEVTGMSEAVARLLSARRTAEGGMPGDNTKDADTLFQMQVEILRQACGSGAYRIYLEIWNDRRAERKVK